jgi:hypothetical protein
MSRPSGDQFGLATFMGMEYISVLPNAARGKATLFPLKSFSSA